MPRCPIISQLLPLETENPVAIVFLVAAQQELYSLILLDVESEDLGREGFLTRAEYHTSSTKLWQQYVMHPDPTAADDYKSKPLPFLF